MRLSIDPMDPAFHTAQDGHFDIVLNGRFFDLGQVITVDEAQGLIIYAPVVGGMICIHPNGEWIRKEVRGRVNIVEAPNPARPN